MAVLTRMTMLPERRFVIDCLSSSSRVDSCGFDLAASLANASKMFVKRNETPSKRVGK